MSGIAFKQLTFTLLLLLSICLGVGEIAVLRFGFFSPIWLERIPAIWSFLFVLDLLVYGKRGFWFLIGAPMVFSLYILLLTTPL
jgi:hypothetical protein